MRLPLEGALPASRQFLLPARLQQEQEQEQEQEHGQTRPTPAGAVPRGFRRCSLFGGGHLGRAGAAAAIAATGTGKDGRGGKRSGKKARPFERSPRTS